MWNTDVILEQILINMGLEFRYSKDIPIHSLLVRESQHNNARFGHPIDLDKCILYASKMREGVSFPAIIVTNGFIIGGNNRIESAIQAKLEKVDAYVIDNITEDQIDELKYRDNNRHGLPLSEDEKIRHMVLRHLEFSIPLTDLNRQNFGENMRTYDKACMFKRAEEITRMITPRGVDMTKFITFPPATRESLHPFIGNINVLTDAANAVVEFKMSTEKAKEMVTLVKTQVTEDSQKRAIVIFRESMQSLLKGERKIHPDSERLETGLTKFKALLSNIKIVGLFVDGKPSKKIKKEIDEIMDLLKKLKVGGGK